MPVASGPKITPLRAVIYSVVSIGVGIGLVFAVVSLAGSGRIDVKLGDDDFNAGDAEALAAEIDDRGPVPWAPLSRNRSIWINHVGSDPEEGWFAFDVQSPGATGDCVVNWDTDRRLFVDSCDPALVYPANGDGLTQFGVWVNDDGDLIVDVNANDPSVATNPRPTPPTEPPSTAAPDLGPSPTPPAPASTEAPTLTSELEVTPTPESPAEVPTAESEQQSEPEFNSFPIPVLGDAHIATDEALGEPFSRNGPMPERIVASTVECHIVSIDTRTGDTTLLWNYTGADNRYFHCNPDQEENPPPNYESTSSFISELEWINPSFLLMSVCCEPAAGRFEFIDTSIDSKPMTFGISGASSSVNTNNVLAFSTPLLFRDVGQFSIATRPFDIDISDSNLVHSTLTLRYPITFYPLTFSPEQGSSADASVTSITWVGNHRLAFTLFTGGIYPDFYPFIGVIDIESQSIIFSSRGNGWYRPVGDTDGNFVVTERQCIKNNAVACDSLGAKIVVVDSDTLAPLYDVAISDTIADMDLLRGWLLVTFTNRKMGIFDLTDGTFTPIANGIVNASWAE